MPQPQSAALAFLAAQRFPYRLYRHTGPVESLEQAARERGQQPNQVVRSLLFRLAAEQYCLVLVAGPQQVDWKLLRQALQAHRMAMATPEEVFQVTGYQVGAVSPFGLRQTVPILVDHHIQELHEISLGSGLPGVAIVMQVQDALAALGNFRWIALPASAT
jgi:Cys-tRNA(Pro)/Cys-tRNA(Cys) deacylase